MARLLKCYGDSCVKNNLKHKKEELIKYHSKNYCHNCYEQIKKDSEEREELIRYLTNLFKKYPSGHVLRSIKEYREIRNYTYREQLYTLKYFIEVEHGNLYNDSVGIIPYVYNKAKNYYYQQEKNKKDVKKIKSNKQKEEASFLLTKNNENNIIKKEEKVPFNFDIDDTFHSNNF